MVPGYVEELAEIPMMTSGKADRKALPPPTAAQRRRRARGHVAPATPAETVLAEALAEVVGLDRVSVESHFFDDLGANSLMLAHFCRPVRRRGGLPPVAMQDVYQNPTVRSLAAALARRSPGGRARAPTRRRCRAWAALHVRPLRRGAAAGLIGLVSARRGAVRHRPALDLAATEPRADLLRRGAFGAGTLVAFTLLPIAGQVAADRPAGSRRRSALWSLRYLRFWVVKTLIRTSPLVVFAGSPLYLLYLRALGAKIGKGVTIFSTTVPVCTDCSPSGGHRDPQGASFTGYNADGRA